MEISDIFPKEGNQQRIYCANCQEHMVLAFEEFKEDLTGIRMIIKEFPMLRCYKCDYKTLPDRRRIWIY